MIKLDIEEYCQNCGEFEPDVHVIEFEEFYGTISRETYVKCSHRDRCDSMVYYLKQRIEREKKEDAE